MRKLGNKMYLVVLFICLNSCFSNEYEYIGKKKVINKEEWTVKFYQFDEFEMFTSVQYEIVENNGNLISKRQRLTGADANLQSVDNFYVKMRDSIFYIYYSYPEVVAIKHIDSINKPNQWNLIKELNKYDTFLYNSHTKNPKQKKDILDKIKENMD